MLSLDETPQMPETQALQQLDHTLVVKVILCGVWMWNDTLLFSPVHKSAWGKLKVLKEIVLGSFLSRSSSFSSTAKMFWVRPGLLPTTVKPFQTYIISCGDGGQMLDVGEDYQEAAGEKAFSHQSRNW